MFLNCVVKPYQRASVSDSSEVCGAHAQTEGRGSCFPPPLRSDEQIRGLVIDLEWLLLGDWLSETFHGFCCHPPPIVNPATNLIIAWYVYSGNVWPDNYEYLFKV